MDSLKKIMCTNYAVLSSLEKMKGNKVFFLTPLGIISGRYMSSEPDENKLCLATLTKGFFNSIPEDAREANGNDGYILLEDVEVAHGSSVSRFPELMIFFDQIIGVTFGAIKSDD